MSGAWGRSALRSVRDWIAGVGELHRLSRSREQNEYLQREVCRLNAAMRRAAWQARRRSGLATQTKASFDFQWEHMPAGRALPDDAVFMQGLAPHIAQLTGLPADWFRGKRIVDVGCGTGRYSYGLLKMGATVTSCDHSEAALRRTGELCHEFGARSTLKRVDLLEWDEPGDFDLAFSFGVVHHTGNTYLAMENVCRKVRPGGKVFFMIYGVPRTLAELREINQYEHIAEEIHDLSLPQRKAWLERRFGAQLAHGWFDATSPRINDRLTVEEIRDLLVELGFGGITRTMNTQNHHVIADRLAQ
ncbi:MAG: class I SAM-dependent methyltransferase [Acidobacteriota bacterium]|nr:class I SAM-dependent methyltransferase [Acidobacteriota bacterium]